MGPKLGRSLIKSMGGQLLPVTRFSTGSYVNGTLVQGTPITGVAALASVQPITGDEIAEVPEGDREREIKKIYSADELFPEGPGPRQADLLALDGFSWLVLTAAKWPQYWKCMIARVDQPDASPTVSRPTIVSAQVLSTGKKLQVTLSTVTAFVLPVQGVTGFTVTVNAAPKTIATAVRVGPKIIELTFATAIIDSDIVLLNYAPGNVTDQQGVTLLALGTPLAVDNNSEAT